MISGHFPERRSITRAKGIFFIRYRYFNPNETRLDIQEFDGMTLDLSEIGLSLITDKEIPLGTSLFIKFLINNDIGNTLSSHRRVIVFTGLSVYSQVLDNGLCRHGIYFGPSKKENQEKFFDIICSVPPYWYERMASRLPDVLAESENSKKNE